jgi:Holliday junction resolvase
MTNSRNKGSSFERDIARELELLTGVSFKRDLEQVRASEHGDLIASDPAFPFLIECKRYASGNGCKPAWQEQATRAAAKNGKLPVVIYKFDRLPIRVAVPMQALGHDYAGWAEIDLPALAYLASELMAARAEGAAV